MSCSAKGWRDDLKGNRTHLVGTVLFVALGDPERGRWAFCDIGGVQWSQNAHLPLYAAKIAYQGNHAMAHRKPGNAVLGGRPPTKGTD